MTVGKRTLLGFVERFARGLRFPQLFWLTAILFVVDLLIPDLIPFADEILLGLTTLLLGSWKKGTPPPPGPATPRGTERPGVIDVDPEP